MSGIPRSHQLAKGQWKEEQTLDVWHTKETGQDASDVEAQDGVGIGIDHNITATRTHVIVGRMEK